ncbi:SDR family oxidoreductase [Streptomyces sp. NPDC057257]|uniref:SDR family oxidoreductase n=1 Tax=Streptomyces sp. NPDC057257 TaxID=3346071 RepID=UPI00364008A4
MVTGAGSGIGAATALALAEAGACVHTTGRSPENLKAIGDQLAATGSGTTAVLNVRDTGAFEQLIARAAEETGQLSILVNNASVRYFTPLMDATPEQEREMIDTLLLAPLAGTRAAVRTMHAHGLAGHIVNISSTSSRLPDQGLYGALKTGIDNLNDTLRIEQENDPIRVIGTLPGAVATNLARHLPPEALQASIAAVQAAPDVTFLLQPEDIARAVVYAVSQPAGISIDEITVNPQADIQPRMH